MTTNDEEILDEEDYHEQQEIAEDAADAQDTEAAEEFAESGSVPYVKRPDSLFSLFQKVWKAPNSTRVSNLDKFELGKPTMTVRDSLYIAKLGYMFKHQKFAQFFNDAAMITNDTAMSKKGWFAELFVSQKKYTQRATTASSVSGSQDKKPWRIFSQGESQAGPEKPAD